jgi:hypothetical protein
MVFTIFFLSVVEPLFEIVDFSIDLGIFFKVVIYFLIDLPNNDLIVDYLLTEALDPPDA